MVTLAEMNSLEKKLKIYVFVSIISVAPMGDNLVAIPAFSDIEIGGEKKTAIKLIIESK